MKSRLTSYPVASERGALRRLLFEAHPGVIDPVQRRVASLMAMFHFASIPLSPLALLITHNYTNPDSNAVDMNWAMAAVACGVLNYFLARSRWYRVTIYAQVVTAFLVVYWTAWQLPHRQSLHFVLVLLPVLMAAHLMSYFELKLVTVASMLGLASLAFFVDGDPRRLIIGSSFALLVLLMMIILIRHHHSWIERVRREKLAAEYARFQSLMEAAYDITLTLESGRVTQVAPGAEELFMRPKSEILGHQIDDLLGLERLSEPHFGETTVLRPDGRVGYVAFAVEPLSNEESFIALRDVTEERLETVQQLQLDRMTQTATLAAGIAHEFNTPIMVLMNQLNKATDFLPSDETEGRAILESAQVELNQLAGIVKDLKWFIQPSEDERCTSPKKVIENAVRLAGHRIRHQSEVIISHGVDMPVAISENQLSQLVLNLLFNANEAGAADTDRSTIQVRTTSLGGAFVLTVTDDGVGMPLSVQSRAFQPFFTYGKTSGTGLGLAICNSIVSQIGGRIDLQSAEGQGTTVTVTLPMAITDEAYVDDSGIDSLVGGASLVVDDNELLSSLVAEMLGVDLTHSVSSIEEALRILGEDKVRLIVCDLNMPNGGAQALYSRLVRMNHPAANQMIVMTGGAVDPMAQAFLSETHMPILYKPFSHADMAKAVARLQ